MHGEAEETRRLDGLSRIVCHPGRRANRRRTRIPPLALARQRKASCRFPWTRWDPALVLVHSCSYRWLATKSTVPHSCGNQCNRITQNWPQLRTGTADAISVFAVRLLAAGPRLDQLKCDLFFCGNAASLMPRLVVLAADMQPDAWRVKVRAFVLLNPHTENTAG